MGSKSSIEWTQSTWNPVTGCTKISLGCCHCYAERMASRLQAMGQPNYADGFEVTLHAHAIQLPLSWKRPRTIFVNSMSDLFHQDIPADFIHRVFEIMDKADWHRYQILTKRSHRLLELDRELHWQPHIWMGVSVESERYVFRIHHLRETHACVRFLSLEPLLGPISNLDLRGIDWVIVGGESGPGARTMKPEWVREIRDRCVDTRVPFFFKQWGGFRKDRAGRKLDGKIWSQMPAATAHCPALGPTRQAALSPISRPNGRFFQNARLLD